MSIGMFSSVLSLTTLIIKIRIAIHTIFVRKDLNNDSSNSLVRVRNELGLVAYLQLHLDVIPFSLEESLII